MAASILDNNNESTTEVIDLTDDNDEENIGLNTFVTNNNKPSSIRVSIDDTYSLPEEAPPSVALLQFPQGTWMWMRSDDDGGDYEQTNQRGKKRKRGNNAYEETGRDVIGLKVAFQSMVAASAAAAGGRGRSSNRITEEAVSQLFVDHNVKVGKWMLKIGNMEHLDAVWKHIRTNMIGRVCCTAKIGIQCGGNNHGSDKSYHLICIYVSDFTNKALVDACLTEIRKVHYREKRLLFKCDGMTYLDLYANNPYKLKVCCYSHENSDGKPIDGKVSSKVLFNF